MITIKTTAKNTSFTSLSIHNGQILNNLTMHISLSCALFHSLFILLIDASGQLATTKNKTIHYHKPPTRELQSESNDLKNIFIYISIERLFFEYPKAMCGSVRAYGAHSFIYLHFICILCLQAFRYSISALDFWLKKL